MSNIDDVKNLYEGIAAEAFKMPEKVDPSDIRKSQRAKKVRNLATDGATEGERAAAAGKTKGPSLMGEGSYEETKRTEVLKSLNKKKDRFKKKYGKDAPDIMYAVADKIAKKKGDTSKSDDRYAYESFLGEKKDEESIGGGNLKKLAKKATKRVDSNVDGTVNSSDMKDSDVGEFVPGPTGGKVKTKARFESWRSDLSPLLERTMTAKDKDEEDRLKDKYDDSDMKENMIKQYGKEEGEKIYYATIRKKAMAEAKSDEGLSADEKEKVRNKRNTPPGEKLSFDTRVFLTRKPGESQDNARGRMRRVEHEKARNIKKERPESPARKRAKDQIKKVLGKKGVIVAAYEFDAQTLEEKRTSKFFPNAEDPFGSSDKMKKRKGIIKNKGAGYKEGQALKQTILKKEGRSGEVENKPTQKDEIRARGNLKVPTPKQVSDRKKAKLERAFNKSAKTPDHVGRKEQLKKNLSKTSSSVDKGMAKAADDIMSRAAKNPKSVGPESKRAASRVLGGDKSDNSERVGSGKQPSKKERVKLNLSRDLAKSGVSMKNDRDGDKPKFSFKRVKLDDTTKGGNVKIVKAAQDKNNSPDRDERSKPKRQVNKKMGPLSEEYLSLYEDVIAALLDSEYALNEESADNLFDSMTEDALTVITEQYLEEKARGTRKKSTAHIYDMDETLYGHDHSKVRVHVNDKSGKRVQSLSNQEFNTHKLDKAKGHKYDFSEFGSSKTFQKSAKPLKKMIKHMKRQKARGYDTHIVTARSDFDDKKHLAKQLKKHGVDITPNKKGTHTHLHRSGNEEGDDVGKKKQRVLSRLGKRHGYKKIHMYDDAEKVHKATHNKTPGVKVKGHMVQPNSKGNVYSRPYKPTKPGTGRNNNSKK